MRRYLFAAAIAAVTLFSSTASADLQSALTPSLRVVQLGYYPDEWSLSVDDLDGSLFVDPLESTFGEPIYDSGPELNYDPVTGDVLISLPPMLGPADEFGLRTTYSPTYLTVHDSGFRADNPRLPRAETYVRGTEIDPSSHSFIVPNDSGHAGISIYDPGHTEEVQLSGFVNHRSGWAGANVTMHEWLSPLLAEGLFTPDPPPVFDNPHDYRYRNYTPLASIEAIITYEPHDGGYLSNNRRLKIRTAVVFKTVSPTSDLAIPEPTAGVQLLSLLCVSSLTRRR